jgi:hypothetical protein
VITVGVGHTTIHEPIPGFVSVAVCCAELAGGTRCPWHADADHDLDAQGRPAVRAAAVAHAHTGHRVVFDDAVSTTAIEVTS